MKKISLLFVMLLAFTVSTTAQSLPKPMNPIIDEWVDSEPTHINPEAGTFMSTCQIGITLGMDWMMVPVADDYPGNEAVFDAMEQGIMLDYTTLEEENVFYSIFTDDDKLFVFTHERFPQDFEEPTTLIPYGFEGMEFGMWEVHFPNLTNNVSALIENGINIEPFFTWRIGIQTYYIVDGDTSASDRIYIEIFPQLKPAAEVTPTSFLADWSGVENTVQCGRFLHYDLYVVNKDNPEEQYVFSNLYEYQQGTAGGTHLVEGLTPGATYQYYVVAQQTYDASYQSVVQEVTLPETIYILGEVNEQGWATNAGTPMEYDAANNVYTATVTFDGRNDGYNYFSFTTRLAENSDDWNAIAPYRFGAVSDGDFWVTDEMLGTELSMEASGDAYRIPAGEYKLTVDYANMTLKIEKIVPEHGYDLGDVNHDGDVNIADVTTLIDYLLGTGTVCDICADVNGDTDINIADVTALIDVLLAAN